MELRQITNGNKPDQNISKNSMPTIHLNKPPKWEHGTAKEVTVILQGRGEDVKYDAVCKRLKSLSNYETVKLAMQVSRRLREERQERATQIRNLIEQAKREGVA